MPTVLSEQNQKRFLARELRRNISRPLFALDDGRIKDRLCLKQHPEQHIHMSQLGLCVITYCYQKAIALDRDGVSQSELVEMLLHQFGSYVDILSPTEGETLTDVFREIVRKIIHVFRPGKGEQIIGECLNLVTMQQERKAYRYLKNAEYTSGEQRYVLDEDGFSLLFSTGEIYDVANNLSTQQIFILQLGLEGNTEEVREQLQKLRLEYEQLSQWMDEFDKTIYRRPHALAEYKNRNETIQKDLQQEKRNFEHFLLPYLNQSLDSAEGDTASYQRLLNIRQILEEQHDQFVELLNRSITLGTKVLSLEMQRFQSIFTETEKISFAEDIMCKLEKPSLSISQLERMVTPFLPRYLKKRWSLFSIGEQTLLSNSKREETAFEAPAQKIPAKYTIYQTKSIRILYEQAFQVLEQETKETSSILLSDFLNHLKEQNIPCSPYLLLLISSLQMLQTISAATDTFHEPDILTLSYLLAVSAPSIQSITAKPVCMDNPKPICFQGHCFTDCMLYIHPYERGI